MNHTIDGLHIHCNNTNSGVSGNTSRDLLQRFDSDVVALNPDWVSICIGINDVWRQFDSPAIPDGQVMPEEIRSKSGKNDSFGKRKSKGHLYFDALLYGA